MDHLCLILLKSDQNILDNILKCFLLVDKAIRFLNKVEIFEQVLKGIDQPSGYW